MRFSARIGPTEGSVQTVEFSADDVEIGIRIASLLVRATDPGGCMLCGMVDDEWKTQANLVCVGGRVLEVAGDPWESLPDISLTPKLGDAVKLASGGPIMTIDAIDCTGFVTDIDLDAKTRKTVERECSPYARCVWHEKGKFQRDIFALAALRLVGDGK